MLWDSLFYYSSSPRSKPQTSDSLTSDPLTDQEVTRSKEMTVSGGNELADFVGLSPVGLREVAFEEVS